MENDLPENLKNQILLHNIEAELNNVLSTHELTLPLYPNMTIEEVDIVCNALISGIQSKS